MYKRKAKLLTVREVSDYLKLDPQTVYDKAKKGKIPHIRIGGNIRFDLNEVINQHRQEVKPKVIGYQPPIVKMCAGKIKAKEDLMRKANGKKKNRWPVKSGTILSRPTKKGVIRFYGIYYTAEGKLKETVLKHARNFDEAVIELNTIYDNIFRAKHNIPQEQKRIKLGEFVKENKINSRIRKEMMKFFADKWLNEINELEVRTYRRRREETGAKNNTINNELSALRKTLNLAKRGGYGIDELIQWGSYIKDCEFRERVLSFEEEDKLMPELAEHLKPIVVAGLNTGMRKGEILSLKWKNIIDGKIVIEAKNTKTKKQRRIPINKTLGRIFEILKSRNGHSEFIFTYGEREIKDVQNGFSKAVKRSGIDPIRFHDLRRTFATRLSQNDFDIYKISQLLGHADVKMTQRYINWQSDDGTEAVLSLDRESSELRDNSGMEEITQPLLPLISPVVS